MELPLAQRGPPGSYKGPGLTFSTFLPLVDSNQRHCQGEGSLGPRVKIKKTEKGPPNPRLPAVPDSTSPQALTDARQAEEVPGEGGQSLQAEIRVWFWKTQAQWLLQSGAAPTWFHGFISRREAERLLESKPQGCYLVRFSESAITFVLTYKSRTCCRHFLLAQLGDGRHVVLGEDSAHARLQDLLQHYTACPLSPYRETLTQPLARQTPNPTGLFLRIEPDSRSKSQDPQAQYSPIVKKEHPIPPTQKQGADEPKEVPRPKPPIPPKPQVPPEVYTSPAQRSRPALPLKPSNPIYNEPEDPIAFYAMGRGSPGEAPGNIYSEVEMEASSGGVDQTTVRQHRALRKCWSRPVLGGQNAGVQQMCSENSVARKGPSLPHQPPPRWGHTLPH